MTTDTLIVFAILLATLLLFASDRWRLDLIALASLLALLLSGILTPAEALEGFSDPVVLMIAGLFVVGGGIFETGIAERIGRWLGKVAGNRPLRLMAVIMLITALLSAFISSTGTVAVMLPVVISLARRANLSPSKLLIPLAFASLLGGMLTLIGTPPNLVVSNQLREEGLEPFGFFSFTPVGLVMLGVGMLFMMLFGQRFLPEKEEKAATVVEAPSLAELVEDYRLRENLYRLQLSAHTQLAGKSLAETKLRTVYGVNVLAVKSAEGQGRRAEPDSVLHAGDQLYVQAREDNLKRLEEDAGLERLELDDPSLPKPLLVAEVLIPPRSRLEGRTLRELKFRDRYGLHVLSAKRGGELPTAELAALRLKAGDSLLATGGRRALGLLRRESRDFVLTTQPEGIKEQAQNTGRAPWAVMIMLGMLVLMTAGIVENVTAVLLAAFAMVASGCLKMDDAYRHINWQSVILIAAILPMATALETTGGMQLIVDGLVSTLGDFSPIVMMAGLFVLTSLFSQVISNTATAVLIAPIAFQAALSLGVSPYSFMMTVAVAGSTAFATPVASPVNTLVLGPGGYRFRDFLKVGVMLQLLIFAAALLVIPILFPLDG